MCYTLNNLSSDFGGIYLGKDVKVIGQKFYKNLLYFAIGNPDNILIQSSRKAYRDMCRTLRLNGDSLLDVRSNVDNYLYKQVNELLDTPELTQENFNVWHKKVCLNIIGFYNDKYPNFSIGQAQKWLNMTLKYFYVSQIDERVNCASSYFHVPLDNYVNEILNNNKIKSFKGAWSKINDYDEYLMIQKGIRINIGNQSPIDWEMEQWLSAALEKKDNQ